jgi:hypothetical protein
MKGLRVSPQKYFIGGKPCEKLLNFSNYAVINIHINMLLE